MNQEYYLSLLNQKIKDTFAELEIAEKKAKTQRASYNAAMAEKVRYLSNHKGGEKNETNHISNDRNSSN